LYWQFLLKKSFIVPTPSGTAAAFIHLLKFPDTWRNIVSTTIRVYISLFFATVIGFILGSTQYFSNYLSAISETLIQPIQYTAAAVVSIVAIVFFGLSPVTPYFVIIIAILPNTYVATRMGLNEMKKDFLELGEIYTNSKLKMFKHIVFPQLIPYTWIGIIRSNAIAWKLAVTAEVFIALDGLGFMVSTYYRMHKTAKLFATVFIIILIGFFFDQLIKTVKNKYFANYDTINTNKKFK